MHFSQEINLVIKETGFKIIHGDYLTKRIPNVYLIRLRVIL